MLGAASAAASGTRNPYVALLSAGLRNTTVHEIPTLTGGASQRRPAPPAGSRITSRIGLTPGLHSVAPDGIFPTP